MSYLRSQLRLVPRGIIALLVLAIAGCTATNAPAGGEDSAGAVGPVAGSEASAPDTAADLAAEGCRAVVEVREPPLCRSLTVDGRLVRYAAWSPDDVTDPAADAVIVDFGGPGISPLAGSGVAARLRELDMIIRGQDPSRRYRYLVFEEPWVVSDVTKECDSAGRSFVREMIGSGGTASAEPVAEEWRRCFDSGHYGWSRDAYRKAVEASLAESGSQLKGFIGVSFGAVRLAYLDHELDWAVLVTPFLPGLSLAGYSSYRAAAIENVATGATGSVGVLAQLAAAENVLDTDLRVSELSQAEQEEIAFDYLGVYGDDQLSLSRVAYYQEVCSVLARDAVAPAGSDSTSNDRLVAKLFTPCEGVANDESASGGLDSLAGARRLCLAYSTADAVIPPESVVDFLERHPTVTGHVDAEVAHGEIALVSKCEIVG